MKIAIMQPYFFPYIGYWQLISAVDLFVIYDDVNFIKGGWINRNRILVKKKEYMFTMPLKMASSNKMINEIKIAEKCEKLLKTVTQSYSKAPYFDETIPIIKKILFNPDMNLASFLEFSIRKICEFVGIDSEIVVSSKIEKNNDLRAQERLLDICGRLKADQYINPIGGQTLYDKYEFQKYEVRLHFIKPSLFAYKQFDTPFIPWLSIIDVLMFNPLQCVKERLEQYELISP